MKDCQVICRLSSKGTYRNTGYNIMTIHEHFLWSTFAPPCRLPVNFKGFGALTEPCLMVPTPVHTDHEDMLRRLLRYLMILSDMYCRVSAETIRRRCCSTEETARDSRVTIPVTRCRHYSVLGNDTARTLVVAASSPWMTAPFHWRPTSMTSSQRHVTTDRLT